MTTREARISYFKKHIAPQIISDKLFNLVKDNLNFMVPSYFYFTLKTIDDNIDADWDWCSVSSNPTLTEEFVLKHFDKFYNAPFESKFILYYMCDYTGISKQFIKDLFKLETLTRVNIDDPNRQFITFYQASCYTFNNIKESAGDPTKMAEIMSQNIERNGFLFMTNIINTSATLYLALMKETYVEYVAAYRIQQWWIRILTNPYHRVGKKDIERIYDQQKLNQVT